MNDARNDDHDAEAKRASITRRRVAVTGASGFLGGALIAALRERGDEVVRLVRHPPRRVDEHPWSPLHGLLLTDGLEPFDVVVHLAGENIAGGRLSARRKQVLRDSRILATSELVESFSALARPPRSFLCASASGFYGNRGDEPLDESAPAGDGFLASLCADWENEAQLARELGSRVVLLRTGLVLHPSGGALKKMLPPFRFGLGGRLGSGEQWMPWISRRDWVAATLFLAAEHDCEGPFNLAAPFPATNQELTEALAAALGRPAIVPAPAFALRLALGELADEALLASTRLVPKKLLDAGFAFADPELAPLLASMLA